MGDRKVMGRKPSFRFPRDNTQAYDLDLADQLLPLST